MNKLQSCKFVNVLPPVAINDNTAWTTTEIDTLGWNHLTVVVNIGATDIAMAVMKMQSSDTSGSGFADVDGLDTDGDTDVFGSAATLPTATDDAGVVVFDIPLSGHKRYWDLAATAGDGAAGAFASAVGILSRGEESPSTATEQGTLNTMVG